MLDFGALAKRMLGKPGVTEEMPFGPEAKVFKVMGKIFVIAAWLEKPVTISLKCDPEDAFMWRARFSSIKPGYHLNKRHWNTLPLDGSVPDEDVLDMIEDSYRLVVKGLKKADRQRLDLENTQNPFEQRG